MCLNVIRIAVAFSLAFPSSYIAGGMSCVKSSLHGGSLEVLVPLLLFSEKVLREDWWLVRQPSPLPSFVVNLNFKFNLSPIFLFAKSCMPR